MPLPFIASQAAGAAAGLGIEAVKQGMEYRQNVKNTNLQLKAQKDMAVYNAKLGLVTGKEMWDYTNYENQRKHMEAAGLNVGLMYGQGGGGGATTSTPTASGNVTGHSAQMGMGIEKGMELGMQQAQMDLIKAQTEKTKAETTKTSEADTKESEARTENLKQVTTNEKIQQDILELEKDIKTVEANVAQETEQDIIKKVKAEAQQMESNVKLLKNQGIISDETYNEIIKQTKISTQKMGLDIIMQKALIKQTGTQTELTEEQKKMTKELSDKYIAEVQRMKEQTGQGWKQLSQDQEKIVIQKLLQEFGTSDPNKIRQWTGVLKDVSGAIRDLTSNEY